MRNPTTGPLTMAVSKVHPRGPAKAEMNVTPLIDVTFLLIIFFMVISNFITEESVEMIVPVLEEPKVREFERMNRVVINIAPQRYTKSDRGDDHLEWSGEPEYVKIGSQYFAMDQMGQVTAVLRRTVAEGPKDEQGGSKMEVVLRADSALNYESVQPVMAAIAHAGVGKLHLVSYLPRHGPGRATGSRP